MKDLNTELLDVKVTGRHPQLFAKVNFLSADAATKSSSESNDYGTGTESIGDLLDFTKQNISFIEGYSICEIPFKSNASGNLALLTESYDTDDIGDSVSEIKLFLVQWKSLSSGEETAYVVTMIPDDCFSLSLHPDYSFLGDMDWFSGVILFSDLEGNHIDTYISSSNVMGHALLLDDSLKDDVPDNWISYSLSLQSPGTKTLHDKYDMYPIGQVAMQDGGGSGGDDDWTVLDEAICIGYHNSGTTTILVYTSDFGWDDPEISDDDWDPKTRERNRLLKSVKLDKGGGSGGSKIDKDTVTVTKKITPGDKKIDVTGKNKDVTDFIADTKKGFKLKVIEKLVSKIDTENVTIEIVESLKDSSGVKVLALTSPTGQIRISTEADDGIIFEELLHVYQFQTEGEGWTDGDKEFEAKVFDAILHFKNGMDFNYIHEDSTHQAFYDFYLDPSETNYYKALNAMRRDPLSYSEKRYPVSGGFSYDERIKHITTLISK